MRTRIFWLAGTVLALTLLSAPSVAYAYLDPVTGSIVLQVLLGGFAGVALFFRLGWRRFVGFFKREDRVVRPEDDSRSAE